MPNEIIDKIIIQTDNFILALKRQYVIKKLYKKIFIHEIMQSLHETHIEGCTTYAMNKASENSSISIIEYLKSINK